MRLILCSFMLMSLACPVLAKPQIKNVQASYGQLGPERKSLEFVHGDELYMRFTVTGFTTDKDGRLRGELAMWVIDSKGKEILKQASPLQQALALGGGTFPGQVNVTIGDGLPSGDYTLKVTITDDLAGASDSFEQKFKCKETDFSMVAIRFWQDADGRVPATVGGTVSQTLYFTARGVGFDKSTGEIDLQFTIEVLDAKGKPVMPKPISTPVRHEDADVVKAATVINLRGEITLNRPGDFILKISLIDKIGKKTTTFEAPMKVTTP